MVAVQETEAREWGGEGTHVVAAVTDTRHARLGMRPNSPRHIRLLRRRTPARDLYHPSHQHLYPFFD